MSALARASFVALLLVFVLVAVANAWVVDDAYITFRTIDNFVHGYGLRWNVDERVQAFTHPLWMMVMTVVYALTREAFYSSLAVCLAASLAAVAVVRRAAGPAGAWRAALFLGLGLSSRAFMDYTTSGLENALSLLLAALFAAEWFSPERAHRPARLERLALWASLAYVNRQDTLLVYLPALALAAAGQWRSDPRGVRRALAVGLGPALAWTAFAVFYYGFPFPNTAYAKALDSNLTAMEKARFGLLYLLVAVEWDRATPLLIAWAVIGAAWRRSGRAAALALGAVLYVGYVVVLAASATHQAGRFFSVPFAVAALVAALSSERPQAAVAATIAVLAGLVAGPAAPLRTLGCAWTPPVPNGALPVIDTRYAVCTEGAALADYRPGVRLPDHPWFKAGLAARRSGERVLYGGPPGSAAMGYYGYAIGPDKHVIDPLGLTDPLLARLPSVRQAHWLGGHFPRPLPAGYLESLRSGGNRIGDPSLHEYYDGLLSITRGPLLGAERWRWIVAVNLGRESHLVREYVSRSSVYRGTP